MNGRRLWPGRALLPWLGVVLVAVSFGTAFADDGGGGGHGQRKLYIYDLMPPLINVSGAMTIADSFGFAPVGQGGTPGAAPAAAQTPMAFQDADGHVRMLFADGSVKIFPEISAGPRRSAPW